MRDPIGTKRGRITSIRRARDAESIYVDNAPAGDPTYDPHGTSRPFRPTHKVRATRTNAHALFQRPSYLDIERRVTTTSPPNPFVKLGAALRQNIQYRLEDNNPFEKLRPVGYGAAGVVAAACVLVLGTTLLAQAFPMKPGGEKVNTSTAAATASDPTTDREGNSISSEIGKPSTTTDAAVAELPVQKEGEAGMPMVDGITEGTMLLYVKAAKTCGMPWQILAAVGRVETNHGTSDATGVNSGQNYAGAKGPMQFMQGTWDKYGLDGNRDGKRDIYNQTDAIYSAASYLCANGAGTEKGINNALWHYNHSDAYVQHVRQTAASYYESAYRTPIPVDAVSASDVAQSHHDYPAVDIPLPQGTPVFAVRKGTVQLVKNDVCGNGVELTGTDGVVYTYCHASVLNAADGARVDAGTLIMHSGGDPGTIGAGNTTGPHLHLEMAVNGQNVCPQSLLQKWMSGQFASPLETTTTECVG